MRAGLGAGALYAMLFRTLPPRTASIDLRATRAIFLLAAFAGAPAFPQSRSQPRFAPPNLSPAGVRALAANCAQCHGTDGHPAPGSTLAPLAGRPRREIAARLAAFKAGTARGATVMDQLAKGYSDEEIAALADYFAARGR
jgi:cytochrome subunit of sulfide dehydrogenase